MGTVTPFRPRIPGRPPPDPRHPRWDDGTPVLIGQPVRHAHHGWSGVVDGVPAADEVLVAWSDGEDGWTDASEHSPDELERP